MMTAVATVAIPACHRGRIYPAFSSTQQNDLLDALAIIHAPEFHTRIVANSGVALDNGFIWPGALDGGGIVANPDGGWIYVCNSELDHHKGGVAALVFNAEAEVIDAYSILSGTNLNCGGSITPWNTWLSCEEYQHGRVWECDPWARFEARKANGLGVFTHESAAIDPRHQMIYLTEDVSDGAFYRYVPNSVSATGRFDLEQGKLQGCWWDKDSRQVKWRNIPEPLAKSQPTRYQVELSPFAGGEGVCYRDGLVYFNTKHDDRIWKYDTERQQLEMVYHASPDDALHGADAMTTTPDGTLWVAEDGDDMQIVALTSDGRQKILLQIQGQDHSEVTGLAFSHDYRRLYFNSQRGPSSRINSPTAGMTYEMTGDFLSWLRQ